MAAAGPRGSVMRQTMEGQAAALAGILADEAPVLAVAQRLRGRRVLAIGTGTSWHAASHLGALLRAAQLARALGADLPGLGEVPAAVEDVYRARRDDRAAPPARLIEFIGGGINQWTAAEGALKIREAAWVASEGLGVEQFLHGPSVALNPSDRLVCLDGGGTWLARIAEVARAAEESGVPVTRVADDRLGELLSIFPLTVAVQRIALEAAETLGVNPDTFGLDRPGHQGWDRLEL